MHEQYQAMIKSIHPNIYRLYLIKIAKWFMLYMPIVVPFYESNGLAMKDIMILAGGLFHCHRGT